ncbi:MAG: hypothetical protein QM765_44860 [Myxococcales bacterium]
MIRHRFLPALVLSLAVPRLAFGAPDAGADLVDVLLDLPAPPRDWRTFVPSSRTETCGPPADDAPAAALVAYWSDRHHDSSLPTAKVRERLLVAVEDDPDLLCDLVAVLPEGPKDQKRVKAVLDLVEKRGGCEEAKTWLMFRGPWFRKSS